MTGTVCAGMLFVAPALASDRPRGMFEVILSAYDSVGDSADRLPIWRLLAPSLLQADRYHFPGPLLPWLLSTGLLLVSHALCRMAILLPPRTQGRMACSRLID